jgi:hypothetical protein
MESAMVYEYSRGREVGDRGEGEEEGRKEYEWLS